MQRTILPAILMLLTLASASAIIESPENTTYGPSVPVALSSAEATNLSYAIDGIINGSCEACTSYEELISLPDGSYTLTASNGTADETVTFTVEALDAYMLYEDGILSASSNKKANLSYAVDLDEQAALCSDCSEANTTLFLEAGNHTITVFARTADETANETITLEVLPEPVGLELTVSSPDNESYLRIVPIEIGTNLEANVTWRLGDDTPTTLCEDCTNASTQLDLDAGTYEITFEASRGDETLTKSVSFTVTDFSILIESPEAQTYEGDVPRNVTFEITASEELDSINVTLDGKSYSCADCDELSRTVKLDEGSYLLQATGYLDGEESRRSVLFAIAKETQDDEQDDDEPRFTVGLNTLPQAVENGEYTDEELAQIIRENELNPGVLNRLIKTGKLGDESIDAILETQWTPPGILHRLFGWLGLGRPSVPEMIAERYSVTERQAQTIAVRPDTPPGLAKKIVEQNRERFESRNANMPRPSNRDDDRIIREGRPVGRQSLPPGLAKRSLDNDDLEFEGYVGSVGEDRFTLEDGTVFHVTEETEFDDINSLEELERALEDGYEIEAEIEYVIEDGKRIATEAEFDIEDRDDDTDDDSSNDDDTDDDDTDDGSKSRGLPWTR